MKHCPTCNRPLEVCKNISLDGFEATIGSYVVRLQGQQARLLEILAKRSPAAVHRDCLIGTVWGNRDLSDPKKSLNVLVWGLRQRLQDACRIETVWGFGYRCVT